MEQTEKSPNVSNPHDKGYKRSLSNPREFLHFLQKYIGEEWMMELTEEQIILCDKEFIEKDYEGKEADLLYRVVRKDGREVYIFLLEELQSYVDQTMIFRLLVYIVNILLRYFLAVDKNVRETAGFRLPAVVPIVFYNGSGKWTPVRCLQEYQKGYEFLGGHILNLEYYLVELTEIEEEYILSTNTVLDNIMYCDKFRKDQELVRAVGTAYRRAGKLGAQEREEFHNWVTHILLSVCDNRQAVEEEIMALAGEGEEVMAFEYTFIRVFKKEKEEMRKQGWDAGVIEGRNEGINEGRKEGRVEERIEAVLELLEELGKIPEELEQTVRGQRDLNILKKWHRLAASAEAFEEFEEKIAACAAGCSEEQST